MQIAATKRRDQIGTARSPASGSSGAVFRAATGEGAGPAPALAGSSGVVGLEALLAFQADTDAAALRRRTAARGRALLDALEAFKLDLVDGQIGAARLEGLTLALAGTPPSGDEGLDRLMAEIDLRVRVELAKLGRFPA